MQQGRFITAAAAAVAALAIGPAAAMAAPGSFTDDAVGDFNAGSHDAAITVADPGLSLTRSMVTEGFDGTTLPSNYAFVGAGFANTTLSPGNLTVDGGVVGENRTYGAGQTLEFRAAFPTPDDFQWIGFASNLSTGPWALVGTGGPGQGFGVSTVGTSGDAPAFDEIGSVDPTTEHTYRIVWNGTTVNYYVDNGSTPVASRTIAAGTTMQPVVSDNTAGNGVVRVNSISQLLYSASGTFESRVRDAGAGKITWGTLSGVANAPASTGVAFATRTGQTPNAGDSTWSGYQAVGPTGAIASPPGRYIQYRAIASTTDNRVAPTLDKVTMSYDVDTSQPATGQSGGTGGGTQGGGTQGGGNSGSSTDNTKPKVTLAAKSLRASKKGAVSFTVGCPSTEKSCVVTLRLKNGKKTVASKTFTVKGGKTKTVTLVLNKATKSLLKKRGSLKLSTVLSATDAAGNHRTTTTTMTVRRAAG
jgi:hypothetical protein